MGTSISLRLVTPYLRAGATAELEMTILAEEAIQVHEVSIRLAIWEGATRRRRDTWTLLDERRMLADRGVIPVGSTSFSATFQIPAKCPPTHDTRPGFVTATATAVMTRRRPWERWETTRAVIVRRISDGPVARRPLQLRSPDGSVTVDLASTCVALGEPIAGLVRWATPVRRATTLTMELVAASRLPEDAPLERRGPARKVRVAPGGHTVPFVFELPPGLPPTFASERHTRDWRLDLQVRGERLRVPLELVDAPEAATGRPAPLPAAELLGARWTALLGAGWEAVSAYPIAGQGVLWPVLRRQEGPSELLLGVMHEPGEGRRIVARIATPPQGLGLRVEPSSPLRELLGSDVEAGDASWDRRYRVTARDEAGAAAHLAAWIGELAALPPLVAWDDTQLTFAGELAADEADDLRPLAGELVRVARAHAGEGAPGGPYR